MYKASKLLIRKFHRLLHMFRTAFSCQAKEQLIFDSDDRGGVGWECVKKAPVRDGLSLSIPLLFYFTCELPSLVTLPRVFLFSSLTWWKLPLSQPVLLLACCCISTHFFIEVPQLLWITFSFRFPFPTQCNREIKSFNGNNVNLTFLFFLSGPELKT